ncbi:McrB family protein [Aquifex aeolicus]|uniref:ATPase dynein-related AAA domain-containing protein n=1 Tax=Aquifex aeolicus (strain VF5) TaxID=224324 RepID=O66887_AQUAE|nr:McrB family protein [Aquifex aeolicus]AAC06851.1 putative protein [Aquifex aeolicus VF5]
MNLKKIKEISLPEEITKSLLSEHQGRRVCKKFDQFSKENQEKLLNFLSKEISNMQEATRIETGQQEKGTCLKNSSLKLDSHIVNSFYNALKTKGFVILAGLSGTGKTKIFEEFVKCFPENHNLFFPIRPDFKDSKSLLGYYNPLKGEYHSTPLLEFILEASKNYLEKGKNADTFFVLFDEMNLARVEYYFADFLSVLEAKRFENKDEAVKTNSFNEFLESLEKDLSVLNEENYKFTSQSIKLHNEDTKDVPKELFLPPNLYFIGTVNIDETTYMFSPKVLDRAFTIEFDVGSFKDYLEFLKANSDDENSNIDENLKEDFINKGEFAVIDKQKIKEFFENEENKKYLKDLEEINNTLKRFGLHFGYRVFDEIVMFLYNSQNSYFKFENLDEAFDLAVKMKVLPKFHGTRQRLEKPVVELLNKLGVKNPEEKITDGIPPIDEIAETQFKHTVHKLLEMFYKLKTQGFASFL